MARSIRVFIGCLACVLLLHASDHSRRTLPYAVDQPFAYTSARTERSNTLLLTFVGDIMAHEVNYSMPDFERIYDGVRQYTTTDDLSFANLEFPVVAGRPYASYPAFNAKPAYVRAAIRGGFDVFSLANNHSDDHGAVGVAATAESLEELAATARIYYAGLRDDPSVSFEPVSIAVRDWIVGFLAVTEFVNTWRSSEYVHIVSLRDAAARRLLLTTVEQYASRYDLFVVSFHGGDEYSVTPNPAKAQFFRELAFAGADVVWGHHPHVLQSWERVDSDGESRFIIHSAGNFISGQRSWLSPYQLDHYRAHTGDSALFRLRAVRDGHRVELHFDDPIAITNYAHPEHGIVVETFAAVLSRQLPDAWRRFYTHRQRSIESVLAAPREGATHQAGPLPSEQGGIVWRTAE